MFLSLIGVVITKENHKGDGESRVTLVPLRATNSWEATEVRSLSQAEKFL